MQTGRTMSASEVRDAIQINLIKSSSDLKKDLAAQLLDGLEQASPARLDTYTPSPVPAKPATYTP